METQLCPAPMHTPSHASHRRKIDELAHTLPDEWRGRKRPHLRSGNVRLRKQKWKRNCAPPPRHAPSPAYQRRTIGDLAHALSDERRGRNRPYLRSGNVRLRKQRWKRNCDPPRGMHHRTHVNDARSMNLRMRCIMSGSAARDRIYALGMYA